MLMEKQPVLYSMAVGGWSGVQYLDMFTNATVFKPRVVIIAFYAGNDPLESFKMVYGIDGWNYLIPDKNLSHSDVPKVVFPTPESEWWKVDFADGIKMTFTPTLRITSNSDHPAVKAGYNIMANVARRISEMAKPLNIKLIFTIIPTKELVYAQKVQKESLNAPEAYTKLVEQESKYIQWLAGKFTSLEHAEYVDLVKPFQEAALAPKALYPENINGHPIAAGYQVIAKSLSANTNKYLPITPTGLLTLRVGKNSYKIILVRDNEVWEFATLELVEKNGWPAGEVPVVDHRMIEHLPRRGAITEVDAERFGPASVN